MSQFSAGPQSLGYLNQIRFSLVTILDNEEATLRLEVLDDIDIQGSNGETKQLQLKHRAEGTMLTDFSTDLWKTIRVWATQVHDGTIDVNSTIFNLITTAIAEPKSAAELLRDNAERNPVQAISKLVDAVANSSNKDLVPAFGAFKALSDQQRAQLFARVFVIDGAPNILKARSILENRLAVAVSREHRATLADTVEGWWVRVMVEHLAGKLPSITGQQVVDKIYSFAQQLHPTSLPVDCYSIKPTEAESGKLHQSTFVSQLKRIDISTARIQNAVLDYHRAFTQRSRWVRDRLLVDEELEGYGERLLDEWNRMRLAFEQQLSPDISDQLLIKLGQELLQWAEFSADIRIRPSVSESYVMRGSFHMLADEDPPRLRWHRNFGVQIKTAIEQNVA